MTTYVTTVTNSGFATQYAKHSDESLKITTKRREASVHPELLFSDTLLCSTKIWLIRHNW